MRPGWIEVLATAACSTRRPRVPSGGMPTSHRSSGSGMSNCQPFEPSGRGFVDDLLQPVAVRVGAVEQLRRIAVEVVAHLLEARRTGKDPLALDALLRLDARQLLPRPRVGLVEVELGAEHEARPEAVPLLAAAELVGRRRQVLGAQPRPELRVRRCRLALPRRDSVGQLREVALGPRRGLRGDGFDRRPWRDPSVGEPDRERLPVAGERGGHVAKASRHPVEVVGARLRHEVEHHAHRRGRRRQVADLTLPFARLDQTDQALDGIEEEQLPEPLGLVLGLGRPQLGRGAAVQLEDPLGAGRRVVGELRRREIHAHPGAADRVDRRQLVDVARGDVSDRRHRHNLRRRPRRGRRRGRRRCRPRGGSPSSAARCRARTRAPAPRRRSS